MKISLVKYLSVEERFLYWIGERESIRKKKEAGKPKPWTDDEILQKYKFCNVRRMDDRVSRWLLKNWYEPHFDHKNMVLACVMARLFNTPEALDEIGFPINGLKVDRTIQVLQRRKDCGLNNFNAAYIVGTVGLKGDKGEIVVRNILVPVSESSFGNIGNFSLEALCADLMALPGIGSFIAGQVSADVRWAVRGLWRDRRVWAPIGPGSKRGLNRLFGRQPEERVPDTQWKIEFKQTRHLVRDGLPEIYKRLEAIDVQNCLCELSKYESALQGNRAPKQRYPGN